MKISAIDIKPGNVLEHNGKLWVVLKREFVQPGKGGAFAQVEMRDLRGAGNKTIERFRTQETVERVQLDEKDMQFLYFEGNQATFMDNENFEQTLVDRELIGEPADFLHDGMICTVRLYEGAALSVELPQTVTVELVEPIPWSRARPPPPPTSRASSRTAAASWCRRMSGREPASSSIPATAAMSSAPRTSSQNP